MKKLVNVFGGLLLLLALVFFLYGSMKTVDAEENTSSVDLGEGLVMSRESEAEVFAEKAFILAGITGVGGVILLLVGRGMKKR